MVEESHAYRFCSLSESCISIFRRFWSGEAFGSKRDERSMGPFGGG